MSSKLMKEEYPKKSVTDGQKNNVLFCSCDDVIKPNEIKLRPCVPLCGRSFLSKRFFKSVHPFQRYCLKTVSSARPAVQLYKGIFNALIRSMIYQYTGLLKMAMLVLFNTCIESGCSGYLPTWLFTSIYFTKVIC